MRSSIFGIHLIATIYLELDKRKFSEESSELEIEIFF